MKKVIAVVLAAVLCCTLLTGCSQEDGIFYTVVEELPDTLDPQLAEKEAECIIAVNLFTGLFRRAEDGTAQPAACESYRVSTDGLIWTFTLREGLVYNDADTPAEATPLCAEDYVFALQRVLSADSISPWAGTFSGIDTMDNGNPAIFSTGKDTLTICLIQPDENLPLKLCCPGAMPCNKAFFESCEGTYGLDTDTVLANGAFRISLMSEENGVTLRRIESREGYLDKIRLLLSAQESAEEVQQLSGSFVQGVPAYETNFYYVQTRILRINAQDAQLADVGVRAGLAGILYRNLAQTQQEGVSTAGGLIAESVLLGEESWRRIAGNIMDEALPADAVESYREGLAREGREKLSGITVLVPDTQEWRSIYDAVATLWQQQLSAFFSVEYLSEEEIVQRVNQNDYQLAFYTHRAQNESVMAELETMVRQFGLQMEPTAESQPEATAESLPEQSAPEEQGASDTQGEETAAEQAEQTVQSTPEEAEEAEEAEPLLQPVQSGLQPVNMEAVYKAQTRQQQEETLKEAELALLKNFVAVPLYAVSEYYSIAPGFSHISVSPFGPMLDFAQAQWSKPGNTKD